MAEKGAKPGLYERPPELGRWQSFKNFVWNSETSQFLGRTFLSWAKILLFYCFFYAGLAGFFSALMAIFYHTLDFHVPKWQQTNGLIGSNPGLGFRPMPSDDHPESTLIWYNTNANKYEKWVEKIDQFLKPYREPDSSVENMLQDCDYDSPAKLCRVNVNHWKPCTKEDGYNYKNGAPCIFLKINKIYGWIPEYYNDTTTLPEEMPADLKKHIETEGRAKKSSLNTVWVSCEGENPADREAIGPIQYIPKRGFAGYYFPYMNVEGYQSPIIAVWFEKPQNGVLINIECKAWAKNIHHDRAERRGSVHFEILID